AAGLAVSYVGDLPTGSAMVCTFGASLAVAGVLYPLRHRGAAEVMRQAFLVGRWAVVIVLAASAVLLMAAPRADHPLFDTIEELFPSARQLYFTRSQIEIFTEAQAYAERYRRDAERLNALETRSRAEGEALDDAQVRRISSYIKSYAEMRRGEEFVKREVRARARERIRWLLGGGMLACSLLLAPGLLTRARTFFARGSPA